MPAFLQHRWRRLKHVWRRSQRRHDHQNGLEKAASGSRHLRSRSCRRRASAISPQALKRGDITRSENLRGERAEAASRVLASRYLVR